MFLAAIGHASRGGDHGPRFIFPFLLFLLLGFLVAAIIRRRRGGGHHSCRHGSPLQTLQDRFARGEIDRAEFEHRKAVLVGADVIPPAPNRQAPTQPAQPEQSEPTAPNVEDPDPDDEQ